MQVAHLLRALKLYALVTLMAADGAFAFGGTAVPQPRPTDQALPAAAAHTTTHAGTLWLIFVDDLHLDFVNTGYLRDVLRAIASELIHDGDVFAVRSSGPSSLSIDLTSDRRRLEASIKNTYGNGLKASDQLRMADEAEVLDEVRYRATVALFAVYRMMTSLVQGHDQRKALIYVSNGYNFDLSPNRSTTTGGANSLLERGTAAGVGRPADQLSALTSMATRSNVTIFAIDPRSLAGAPSPDPDVVAWDPYWTTTRNSLRVICEQTGGFALVDEQDLAETLKRISSAMRN